MPITRPAYVVRILDGDQAPRYHHIFMTVSVGMAWMQKHRPKVWARICAARILKQVEIVVHDDDKSRWFYGNKPEPDDVGEMTHSG